MGENPIIQFNAHRVYTYNQVIEMFNELKLIEFAFIEKKSDNGLIINPSLDIINKEKYGCGCFWFKK